MGWMRKIIMNVKSSRGKARQRIRKREGGYLNSSVKESSIEDSSEYKEMTRMSHHGFGRQITHVLERGW